MAGTGDAAALRRRRMKRELAAMLAAAGLIGAGLWSVAAASKGGKGGTVYDHKLTAIDGTPMPMEQFRGKVILLVNTASFCGFTPQYEGLQKLQTTYGPRGFTVIGVPSGNFLGQEYKSNKEIRSEEHTSELQSLMRISYAVFCLKKKIKSQQHLHITQHNIKYI